MCHFMHFSLKILEFTDISLQYLKLRRFFDVLNQLRITDLSVSTIEITEVSVIFIDVYNALFFLLPLLWSPLFSKGIHTLYYYCCLGISLSIFLKGTHNQSQKYSDPNYQKPILYPDMFYKSYSWHS